jgi:hypothetical protein
MVEFVSETLMGTSESSDERLPEEYERCLVGINSILREAWNTATAAENGMEAIAHMMKLAIIFLHTTRHMILYACIERTQKISFYEVC